MSYRNDLEGSWYIQEICDVFFKNAAKMGVEDMLKLVDYVYFRKNIAPPGIYNLVIDLVDILSLSPIIQFFVYKQTSCIGK